MNAPGQGNDLWAAIVAFNDKWFPDWRSTPLIYLSNALAGEVGEVCGATKHMVGGGTHATGEGSAELMEEIADVYLYLALLVLTHGQTEAGLLAAIRAKMAKNEARMESRRAGAPQPPATAPGDVMRGVPLDPDQRPLARCAYPDCTATDNQPLYLLVLRGRVMTVCEPDYRGRLRQGGAAREAPPPVAAPAEETCPRCRGSGKLHDFGTGGEHPMETRCVILPGEQVMSCPACNGTGKVPHDSGPARGAGKEERR